MCGICGFNSNDPELLLGMMEELVHRGPDQQGQYCGGHWSLGHRRLSIIDLSEHGRQPMGSADGSIQVVFNGEIYNFAEIRAELEAKGYSFRGHSDSEVIPAAYQEYGIDCVHRFQGMFAIAILDERSDELYLIRDRIGIKPLYYYHEGDRFAFASEIKAILADKSIERRVNHAAIYSYLGFEFVPAPATMFANIHKLPAGHYLRMKNGEIEIESYWDLDFSKADEDGFNEDEAVEELRGLLDQAVQARLVSDVPLGAFLSGGLDSSTIVAMMRRHVSGKLRTFTIGYEDKTFSELDYAQQIADCFDTEHHVLMIEQISPELIEESLWHFDEPMTDLSSIPLMLACRKARKDVTVVLSGEGGDEVFAGYDRFKASKLNSYYSALLPRPVRDKLVAPLVAMLPDQPQKKGAINMLKRFVEGSILPAEAEHLRWQYFSNAARDQLLFNEDFKREVDMDPFAVLRGYSRRCHDFDRVNRECYLDTRFEMPDSVLMKVDKMSMANSLEIRVPLLDHRIAEFMARVPGRRKLKGLQTKAIFRKALDGILPKNIVYRGKQGYSLPVKNFLRNDLREYMTDLLKSSPVISENTNADYVQQLIDEHMARKHNHNHVLWGLMHTAIWYRRFFQ